MTTHDWHSPAEQLDAYRAGTLGGAAAASVEAHLLHCDRCRRELARAARTEGAPRQDAVWSGIADAVDQPTRGSRLDTAWLRLTAGTPTLRWLTLTLVLAILVPPVLATTVSGRAGWLLLFLVAPLAPVAGVVAAYRPEVDPAGQMAGATPLASFRLVLLRALVVIGVALPIGVVTSVLLPARLTLLLGWLLPGLALCSVVLVVGTRVDPTRLAVGLSLAWAATVLAAGARVRRLPVEDALDGLFVNHAAVQQLSGLIVVVACALLVSRRDTLTPWSTA